MAKLSEPMAGLACMHMLCVTVTVCPLGPALLACQHNKAVGMCRLTQLLSACGSVRQRT